MRVHKCLNETGKSGAGERKERRKGKTESKKRVQKTLGLGSLSLFAGRCLPASWSINKTDKNGGKSVTVLLFTHQWSGQQKEKPTKELIDHLGGLYLAGPTLRLVAGFNVLNTSTTSQATTTRQKNKERVQSPSTEASVFPSDWSLNQRKEKSNTNWNEMFLANE